MYFVSSYRAGMDELQTDCNAFIQNAEHFSVSLVIISVFMARYPDFMKV